MGKRAVLIPILLLSLAGLLVWRVRRFEAQRNGPTGGSTVVEGTETVVASKIAGRLVSLSVREGDRVAARQIVGEFECRDERALLAAATARLAAADAQRGVASATVAQAQRTSGVADAQKGVAQAQEQVLVVDQERANKDLARTSALLDAGAVSDSVYDNDALRVKNLERQRALARATERTAQASTDATRAAVRTAAQQLAAADAQLVAARADVERAELQVEECHLTAPRNGVVTERLHEPGAVLPAGGRVLSVLDLSMVKATFYVPNAELGRVSVGAPAELRVDAYPGRVFLGTVRRIASEAEFTPRDVQTREDRDRLVYAVEVEIPNEGAGLRAGMPGDIALLAPAGPLRDTAAAARP